MQDLSLLTKSNASDAKLDGKSDIRDSLFEAGFIEDAAKQQGVTNFADVLASELAFDNPNAAITEEMSDAQVIASESIEIADEHQPDIGAIASLFLGHAETTSKGVSKSAVTALHPQQELKSVVASGLIENESVGNDNSQENQLLNADDEALKTLSELPKSDAKQVKSAQTKHGLLQGHQNIREVDRLASEEGMGQSKMTAMTEPKLDNLSRALFKVEQNPTVSSMTQSMLATENSLQKVAGESVSSNHINTPFSNPNWSQAVQQKVLWMVGAADKSATLTLNPPELGPLKVVVSIDNQSVDTTFISESPEVRQALQDSMASLKDRMLESGIQLGQTNIGNNAQSEQAFQQALKQNNGNGQTLENASENDLQDATNQVEQIIRKESGDGLVDTFV